MSRFWGRLEHCPRLEGTETLQTCGTQVLALTRNQQTLTTKSVTEHFAPLSLRTTMESQPNYTRATWGGTAPHRQRQGGSNRGETRKSRQAIAMDTLTILEQGWYELPNVSNADQNETTRVVSIDQQMEDAINNTHVYTDQETGLLFGTPKEEAEQGRSLSEKRIELPGQPVEYVVNGLTTLDAVRQLVAEHRQQQSHHHSSVTPKIFCLNFASARNAGGGFLNGSQAQEESLARASGLYPCLTQGPNVTRQYYRANDHVGAPFYTDAMIYSPRVPVFKDETGRLMEEPMLVSFLTAPAVNRSASRYAKRGKRDNQNRNNRTRDEDLDPTAFDREVQIVMRRRIAKVLAIARQEGHDTLVLGAWGCGVFGNDPRHVAQWFKEELTNKDNITAFRKVVFAVYSPRDFKFINAFQTEFQSIECGNG